MLKISTIIVGDILNRNRSFITTLSVEEMLNIFVFLNDNNEDNGVFNQEMIRRNSNFAIPTGVVSSGTGKGGSGNLSNPANRLPPVLDHEILPNSNEMYQVHKQIMIS